MKNERFIIIVLIFLLISVVFYFTIQPEEIVEIETIRIQYALVDSIDYDKLPQEARDTIQKILEFKNFTNPHPYANEEGKRIDTMLLPKFGDNYYVTHYVRSPNIDYHNDATGSGQRRIITGLNNEFYYTDNHYKTFRIIRNVNNSLEN